jgi:hypothetical protein
MEINRRANRPTIAAFVLLIGAALVIIAMARLFLLPMARPSGDPPSPPFPSVIRGKPVTWIPDAEVRAIVRDLQPQDIAELVLRGGGRTGAPSWTSLVIREPHKVALFLDGMRVAVRRDGDTCSRDWGMTSPRDWPDSLTLRLRRFRSGELEERKIYFFADILEGSQYLMPCYGTVSSRFQDALRAAGIPTRPARGTVEGWMYELRFNRLREQ